MLLLWAHWRAAGHITSSFALMKVLRPSFELRNWKVAVVLNTLDRSNSHTSSPAASSPMVRTGSRFALAISPKSASASTAWTSLASDNAASFFMAPSTLRGPSLSGSVSISRDPVSVSPSWTAFFSCRLRPKDA